MLIARAYFGALLSAFKVRNAGMGILHSLHKRSKIGAFPCASVYKEVSPALPICALGSFTDLHSK
jgi:hypothetical protein